MTFDIAEQQELIQAASTLLDVCGRGGSTPGVLLSLFDFQESLGLANDARETLLELARSVRDDSHFQYVSLVRALLLMHAGDDAPLNGELERLKAMAREHRRRLLLQEGVSIDDRKVHQFDLPRELSLASRLQKSRILPDADYVQVVQDLCDVASVASPTPSTTLHAIEERGMRCHEKAVEYLIEQSGLPFVSLSSYQTPEEVQEWLAPEFSRHRAAVVFGSVGPEALVAVLNPFNHRLQQDARAYVNRGCHFFLTSASHYNDRMKILHQGE